MDKRKSLVGIGLILALMAFTGYMLLRDMSFSRLASTLRQLNPLWLLVGLGMMFVFVGSEALCSRIVLGRLGHKVRYRRCLGYSFVGFYVSSITPSSTGGQPAQVYYMSKDNIPAAHGALNMMLIAVCYQAVVIVYALAAALTHFYLVQNLGSGLGLLLLYGVVVNGSLTVGMLSLMFLPNAARKLTGGVLKLLVKVRIIRNGDKARQRLEKQMEEYHKGAQCVKQNPGMMVGLVLITIIQLTALFSIPVAVYYAFGLSGASPLEIIATQALVTLAVANLPLPGAVGASEGGFVTAMALFFGSSLVTPAVLVSRGISFYSFLVISAIVALAVHLRTRRQRRMEDSTPYPKQARGPIVT
ncbi:lysylphosphatidylglycerol synthase transmembrane domain-containing protein [Flavonifractor sp. An91]|uniref:lysylphosphatidylglycerol synthase transmembrane domain-containing protein n=1 Tax=Flavonifractor sp. An91 TaxID=1965665 RepID=UPI000B399DED|nr:lysylphosphatidylglycerol synthase transmembrane domain-containing protein [Flavonifractor sp. An91]OUN09979.1 TIGR00374 family protein [Flavonifractor sp. An91]